MSVFRTSAIRSLPMSVRTSTSTCCARTNCAKSVTSPYSKFWLKTVSPSPVVTGRCPT